MKFEGQAQSILAKIMAVIPGFFFKGAMTKAIHKDLEDIKAVVES